MAVGKLPNLETALDVLGEAEREQAFWDYHYQELLQEFADQFVAVVNNQVIASAPDLRRLAEALTAKGLNITETWVRFIDSNPTRLIL